jgi:uncharacterized protein YqjF (DUF2071 family)
VDSEKPFLTAEWRYLAMLNYEVDAALLLPFIPHGTKLDRWNSKVFVSLVGFRFLKTRVLGFPIPFHSNFDEVNLRFYVRCEHAGELRRGVVFIREIVPRRAIAWVARTVYNENYVALPMAHELRPSGNGGMAAEYRWQTSQWNAIRIETSGAPVMPQEGSQEQFITEHYWGYAAQSDGGCVEYRVSHPAWKAWSARRAEFTGEAQELYGRELSAVLKTEPASAFLAEGSAVTVMRGRNL